jgi:apolipoprotein N-acyltransferase
MTKNDHIRGVERIKGVTLPTWLLVVLPAILFGLAWEPMPFTPLVFVAFVPFLLLAYRGMKDKGLPYFGRLFLALMLWNIATTWWVWFASDVGAIAMLLMNSFFMYLPFGLWRMWHKRAPRSWQLRWRFDVIFIGIWLLYEFAHHRWDLSWPWLCLGNAFSGMTWYVQWYEISGTLGGSALILAVNVLVFRAILLWRSHSETAAIPFWKRAAAKPLFTAGTLVVLMGLISVLSLIHI